MNLRIINPEEIKSEHFAHDEVLKNEDDRWERISKLLKAVLLSNVEHQEIGIVIKLDSGEIIETFSNLIDFAEDYVMIKGGASIPLKAIVDVEF
jgi:hypothetical protein